MNKCTKEVKKEFPNLFDEKFTSRKKMVINTIK